MVDRSSGNGRPIPNYLQIKRIMKNMNIKFSTVNNEVEQVVPKEKSTLRNKRIDEEGLFGLFTANIMKLRKRFTR
jgi:hypothetical protein